jgi:hypothetical protein
MENDIRMRRTENKIYQRLSKKGRSVVENDGYMKHGDT